MRNLVAILLLSTSLFATAADLTLAEEKCIATALYHESRGESDVGKLYVASVIINRSEDPRWKPDNACGIVYEKGQFTFDHKKKVSEWESWNKAKGIIGLIQSGLVETLPKFLFFHNKNVPGMCTNKPSRKKKVEGNHVFC